MGLVPVSALPLYPRLLGRGFAELDEPVRAFCFTTSERVVRGRVVLRRGRGLICRLVGWLLRLPREARRGEPQAAPADAAADRSPIARIGSADDRGAVPLLLRLVPRRGGEAWERRLGDGWLVTEQRALRGGVLGERVGPLELRARPAARDGALVLEATGAALRLGPLALPLPRALAPRLTMRLWSGEDGTLRLRASLSAPLCGALLEYEAQIEE